MTKRRLLLLCMLLLVVLTSVYVSRRPLLFIPTHAHCIKFAGLRLEEFADEHDGKFPYSPKGYSNALLLLEEDYYHALTGPGYDAAPFRQAKRDGTDLPEDACGRVYVQGLTRKSNPEIALLFDKLPSPGGDHCHMPFRLFARAGREVWCVGCSLHFIPESDWPAFAARQVELLVNEGFPRAEAERLFSSEPSGQ